MKFLKFLTIFGFLGYISQANCRNPDTSGSYNDSSFIDHNYNDSSHGYNNHENKKFMPNESRNNNENLKQPIYNTESRYDQKPQNYSQSEHDQHIHNPGYEQKSQIPFQPAYNNDTPQPRYDQKPLDIPQSKYDQKSHEDPQSRYDQKNFDSSQQRYDQKPMNFSQPRYDQQPSHNMQPGNSQFSPESQSQSHDLQQSDVLTKKFGDLKCNVLSLSKEIALGMERNAMLVSLDHYLTKSMNHYITYMIRFIGCHVANAKQKGYKPMLENILDYMTNLVIDGVKEFVTEICG